MDEKLLRKIDKVTAYSLNLYMNFFGCGAIPVFDTAGPGQALNCKLPLFCRFGDNVDALHIYDDGDARLLDDFNGITTTQFLYDIEVFSRVHPEVAGKITSGCFLEFAKRMFLRYNENHFSVFYTKETKLARWLNLAGAKCIADIDSAAGRDIAKDIIPDKILLYSTGARSIAEEFYEKYKREKRVEVLYPLQLIREWIIELTCAYFKRLFEKHGVSFHLLNWEAAQNTLILTDGKLTSEKIDARARYGVRFISGNEAQYEPFLQNVFGDDYSAEYARSVLAVPPKAELRAGYSGHPDRSGKYLNITGGERFTPGQSAAAANNIYLFGGCVFFGYAIDDGNTVPSQLQTLLNREFGKGRWNVRNYAAWGGNFDEMFGALYSLKIRRGDIIVVSYAGLTPIGDGDVSVGLETAGSDREFYFDILLHCNKTGYSAAAERLKSLLRSELTVKAPERDIPVRIKDAYSGGIARMAGEGRQ